MEATHTTTVSPFKPDYSAVVVSLCAALGQTIPVGYLTHLKALRQKRGLSQARLAELVGVEQPTIQRWERGKRMPDLDNLQLLAKVLGVSAGSLLDGDALVGIGPTLFIKGEVAAGVWRAAAEWPESDWQTFTGRSDVNAKVDHRFGLRIVGDSMDLLYPPGTIVECVSLFGHVEPTPGKRVVIVRKNARGEYESTVKELVEQDGAMWAVPRSSNPAHRQINLSEPEPGILETRIVAVVVASIRPE